MFKALVLVRNLESKTEHLDFGEFTISLVGLRFSELRQVFSSLDINQDDWILEKSYAQLPPGPPGSPVGGIPGDVEDILLLLRLYKAGDISFVKLAIVPPSGNTLVQFPYRAMNDLNSYSTPQFEVNAEECALWQAFADPIRKSQSWTCDWFATARRFFLGGGAKQFNPKWDDVDRIVDYSTALESTLVPEQDYSTRRLSRRAAGLITRQNHEDPGGVVAFIRQFYEIRSQIVHGSKLGDKSRRWLSENQKLIELRVRQILAAAVTQLPPGEEERRAALAGLYDLTDEERGNSAYDKFKEIKTAPVRKATASKIAQAAAG